MLPVPHPAEVAARIARYGALAADRPAIAAALTDWMAGAPLDTSAQRLVDLTLDTNRAFQIGRLCTSQETVP